MKDLIQKYGKQLIKELLDLMIISRRVDSESLRLTLIKYGVIKKTTKSLKAYFSRYQESGKLPNGKWGMINDWENKLAIKNGRNQYVFPIIKFNDSELPKILEVLNDEVNTHNE